MTYGSCDRMIGENKKSVRLLFQLSWEKQSKAKKRKTKPEVQMAMFVIFHEVNDIDRNQNVSNFHSEILSYTDYSILMIPFWLAISSNSEKNVTIT